MPTPPLTQSILKLQAALPLVILVTVFARVVPLEMQKRIVNEAIFLGDIELLMLYCGIYLAAVVLASGLKYAINILQALIGQRALAEMRKALYHHILTLPLNFFRETHPGMATASPTTRRLTDETVANLSLGTEFLYENEDLGVTASNSYAVRHIHSACLQIPINFKRLIFL